MPLQSYEDVFHCSKQTIWQRKIIFTFWAKFLQTIKRISEDVQWVKPSQNKQVRESVAVCEVVSDFLNRKACCGISWASQTQICRGVVQRIQEVGPQRWQLWYYLRRDRRCCTIPSAWCNSFSPVVDIPDSWDQSSFAGIVYNCL